MRKLYTMQEISKMAGVSKGTLDRLVNKRGDISKKSLDKLQKVFDRVGYRPNLIARNLKVNKIYLVCVVIPKSDQDPFWKPFREGAERIGARYHQWKVDVDIMEYDKNNPDNFLEACRRAIGEEPDGIVMAPSFDDVTKTVLKECKDSGVLVSTFVNDIKDDLVASHVGVDSVLAGRIAAKIACSNNKKNIGIVHVDTVKNHGIYTQEKGFEDFLKDNSVNDVKVNTVETNSEALKDKSSKQLLKFFEGLDYIYVSCHKADEVVDFLGDEADGKFIVGHDLTDSNRRALEDKKIDYLLYQDPQRQSELATTFIIDKFLFLKEDLKTHQLIPIEIINSESVKSYPKDA